MKTERKSRDALYDASTTPSADRPYRAAFRESENVDYIAYFKNFADIEKFARNEYIYDVGVSVTFIVYNLIRDERRV